MKLFISKYLLGYLKSLTIAGIGLYLGYHLVQGDNGAVSYFLVAEELVETNKILLSKREERIGLEHQVSLLQPETIDRDMLIERARLILNYGKEGEIVIFYK